MAFVSRSFWRQNVKKNQVFQIKLHSSRQIKSLYSIFLYPINVLRENFPDKKKLFFVVPLETN